MKNKFKKIITATVVSAMSLSALGIATTNNSTNNDKTVQNYLSDKQIEMASAKVPNKNIGKIVETSTNNQIQYQTSGRPIQFLNNDISEAEVENNIVIPNTIEGFNLFVLSTTPFVRFTNDSDELKINVKFANTTNETESTTETTKSETTNTEATKEEKEKLNTYNLKRSILMIYANEIYNNNVNLSTENKLAINTHIQTISNSNDTNLTNVETLDNKISALNSMINIIETNLAPNSIYYQKSLNSTYDNFVENSSTQIDSITENSTNQEIANKIACTLNGKCKSDEVKTNNLNEQNNLNLTNNNQTNLSRNLINNQNNRRNLVSNQISNQNQETQINTENNTNETTNTQTNNNYRRLPNSVRRRRRNIENNINSSAVDITENQNSTLNNRSNFNNNLRNENLMQENTKTMRANRTNENQTQEKYTNTNSNINETNRATRVPYQSTNNNYHR